MFFFFYIANTMLTFVKLSWICIEAIVNSSLNIVNDDLVKILLFGNCELSLELTLTKIKPSINDNENSKRVKYLPFRNQSYFCTKSLFRFVQLIYKISMYYFDNFTTFTVSFSCSNYFWGIWCCQLDHTFSILWFLPFCLAYAIFI